MKPKITWEMRVAVINSSHMPGPYACEDMFHFWNKEEEVPVLYIGDPDNETPEWAATVAKPLLEQGFEWVRFDCCGDVIEGLPTFNWD